MEREERRERETLIPDWKAEKVATLAVARHRILLASMNQILSHNSLLSLTHNFTAELRASHRLNHTQVLWLPVLVKTVTEVRDGRRLHRTVNQQLIICFTALMYNPSNLSCVQ